ncbi:MAG: biotin/lipoyl-binding protein, partial [Nitrospira sp.]|nr:biotin/lipoyl-binding protein [Nitrospira sp.]
MSIEPEEPTRHVPVTEVVPRQAVTPPAHHRPDALPEHGRSDSVIPFPARLRRLPRLGLIGITLAAAAGGMGLWYWWTAGPPPVRYITMPVDRGPITAIVTATGTVNPVVSVLVGSQVSGKISQLFSDFNSVVTQGQTLAQIDPQPFKARVSQARAAVKSAGGTLAKAKNMAAQRKRERDRIATLRQEAFVSQA